MPDVPQQRPSDGGPAFPFERRGDPDMYWTDGMSLRDYFAGQALVALAHKPTYEQWLPNSSAEQARYCYKIADAMLAARKQTEGSDA